MNLKFHSSSMFKVILLVPAAIYLEVFFTCLSPSSLLLQYQIYFCITSRCIKSLQVSSKGYSGHKMLKFVYFKSKGQITLPQQIAPKISASREGNSAKSALANCTVFAH